MDKKCMDNYLEKEWLKILNENSAIYIYGAGKIGKKILKLIQKDGKVHKVKGFLVTDLEGNSDKIENIPVMLSKSVKDKTNLILVSVADKYQDAIVDKLKRENFVNVIIALKYSFMIEENTNRVSKAIRIDSKELLLCQYRDSIFDRYDIMVRLLAIENYYGKNDSGFDLYSRMQQIRSGEEQYGDVAIQRFCKLIRSYEEHGYKEESELIVDEKLHLIDGAHRLALAVYFQIPRLKIRMVPKTEEIHFGKEWFLRFFNQEEIQLIENKVLREEQLWKQTIKGILWPSVICYFDEIVEKIRKQYVVENIYDFTFGQKEFEQIVYQIYNIDSIAEWKVNTKLKYMKSFPIYQIRTFDINLGNPNYRVNDTGERILSDKGAVLKEYIRELYKGRVADYFPDIIIHTADNFYQSRHIEEILKNYEKNRL